MSINAQLVHIVDSVDSDYISLTLYHWPETVYLSLQGHRQSRYFNSLRNMVPISDNCIFMPKLWEWMDSPKLSSRQSYESYELLILLCHEMYMHAPSQHFYKYAWTSKSCISPYKCILPFTSIWVISYPRMGCIV